MELNYKQIVSNDYQILNLEGEDYIVSRYSPLSPTETTITIYESPDDDISFQKNDAKRLYEILSQATTSERILSFCSNYGTLVNYKSPIKEGRFFRTSTQITNAYKIDIETLSNNDSFYHATTINGEPHLAFDHMHINHFNYYVYTLKLLDELYNENIKSISYNDAISLVEDLKKYHSYTYTMLAFEYYLDTDFFSYLAAFPFYQHVLRFADTLFLNAYELDTDFSNNLCRCLCQGPPKDEDNNTSEQEKFISIVLKIAPKIYADIINFHMKEIPFSLLTPALYDPSGLSFFTLGDGIIFQKILDMTSSNRKRRCRNELCRNYFSPNSDRKLYCCKQCRFRYHNRKSMQKKRKQQCNSTQ